MSVWPEISIGEISEVKGGKRLPAGTSLVATPTRHPYLRIVDFVPGSVDSSSLLYVPDDVFPSIMRYTINKGDVFISIVGTVGIVGTIPKELDGANLTENAAKIVVDRSRYDSNFLKYFLMSDEGQRRIDAMTVGSTQKKLALFRIKDIVVPFPPHSQQKEISAILEALDDKIELNRKMAATLEEMARALYRSWFVDFDPVHAKAEGRVPAHMDAATATLFPDSFGEDGLPEGWCWSDIGPELEILDSRRVPLSKPQREKKRGSIPYYGATSVMDYVDQALFDEELLLVGEDGSVIRPDGSPYTQYIWGPSWVNNHAHVIKGKRFSVAQLKCFFDQVEIAPFVNGAVQAKLNQGNLKRIPFMKAVGEVHLAFDQMLESWFSRVRSLSEENQTLASLRDTLLPRLMSGELRVGAAKELIEEVA